MQIVIDISDLDYFDIKHGYADNYQRERLVESVKRSIAIPKNHGRLIDADAYKKEMLNSREFDFFKRLDMQLTIIEADKEA